MGDISFLPQSLRKQEEEIKYSSLEQEQAASVSMHIPKSEEPEDIEIIEVDEAEVEQMLIGEPLYSRVYYKLSLWIDDLRDKYLKPRPIEPPPKLPPQFFTPPKTVREPLPPAKTQAVSAVPPTASPIPSAPEAQPSLAPAVKEGVKSQSPAAIAARPKARIIPSGATPRRRVRIIKRVRKPVSVSLLDEDYMRQMQVNVPKRQFTAIFLFVLFGVVFGASYLLLDRLQVAAAADNQVLSQNLSDLKNQITVEQQKWNGFQDLEPRLVQLNALLNDHTSVNRILTFLEEHTLSDVSYSNFTMDNTGRVSLSATAGSLAATARQLIIFREASEVAAVDSTAFQFVNTESGSSVNFQLLIQFKPSAFKFASSTTP